MEKVILKRVIHICICMTIHSAVQQEVHNIVTNCTDFKKERFNSTYKVMAPSTPHGLFLELRTVPCCPVSSQLRHFEDPAQPVPTEPKVHCPQLQQFHQPTRNPLWLGGSKMEKPQLISGLLSTSASPRAAQGSQAPGKWAFGPTGVTGRLALSSSRCLI